jgi:hypothetical protein
MCIVIVNLKERQKSEGMVLCGQNDAEGSIVELLEPPAGSEAGDHVIFSGHDRKPEKILEEVVLMESDGVTPVKRNKKKVMQTALDRLLPSFVVNAAGKAAWGEVVWATAKGEITAPVVKNGIIK